jgi:hypothetical protein
LRCLYGNFVGFSLGTKNKTHQAKHSLHFADNTTSRHNNNNNTLKNYYSIQWWQQYFKDNLKYYYYTLNINWPISIEF